MRTYLSWFCIPVLALASATMAQAEDSSPYFKPAPKIGEHLDDVFSRTISFKGKDFSEKATRVSGTATHIFQGYDKDMLLFDASYRYDAKAEGAHKSRMIDGEKAPCDDAGKCAVNTDASGLLFNPLLWGTPPGSLQPGASWVVQIRQPWELGPPGTETVRVIRMDAANHVITLEREGRGDGAYQDDQSQVDVVKDGKTVSANLIPGATHWIGYTSFQSGVVVSDELLSERPVTLVTQEFGKLDAVERQYILLNAMPGGA